MHRATGRVLHVQAILVQRLRIIPLPVATGTRVLVGLHVPTPRSLSALIAVMVAPSDRDSPDYLDSARQGDITWGSMEPVRGAERIADEWRPDPWALAPYRWWDGRGWTRHLSAEQTTPPTRKWWVVPLVGVAVVGGLATVGAFLLAHRFDSPWRARVVSVEGPMVCTTPDRGEKDPGWADPLCFDRGLRTEGGRQVVVSVGDCVELESSHPAIYANRIVPCA